MTDLDRHLTERALQSLDAELRRRETLFAAAGVADLGAYRQARTTTEALGRLVLMVDEFAALAEELPEFVTGLVGIAQRGRSLGVHLILATQRPGGVVSPEIRANTTLRIALRVTDPAESHDVVGCDLAARIDRHLPGRAVIRSGRTVVEAQVARVSTPVASGADIDVVALDRWGSPPDRNRKPVEGRSTDLAVIAAALRGAAERHPTVALRRPWLDPLPRSLDLKSLSTAPLSSGQPSTGSLSFDERGPTIVLGLTDRPAQQAQLPFSLDLSAPTTMVFSGGPRSGRTSLLRTAAAITAAALEVDEVHIYAIDCAGGGLAALAELPHCGAVVSNDSPSTVTALVRRLAHELNRRQGVRPGGRTTSRVSSRPISRPTSRPTSAGGHGVDGRGDATSLAGSGEGDTADPALLVLLDGWEGFLAAVEDLDAGRTVDTFLQLLRDGTGHGVTVLVAGDRATLTSRLASAVQRRFVLRMSDPADYAIAGLSRGQIPASMPPGRVIDTADATQTQLGTLGPGDGPDTETSEHAELDRIIARCRSQAAQKPARRQPFEVRALPRRVRLTELPQPRRRGEILLGVGGDAAGPIAVNLAVDPASDRATNRTMDLLTERTTERAIDRRIGRVTDRASDRASGGPFRLDVRFLVAGPPRSGRSTLLTLILRQLSELDRPVIVAAGPRSPLHRAGADLAVRVIGPGGGGPDRSERVGALLASGDPLCLLVDDTELFLDTPAGEWLTALVRRSPPGLDVFAAGRTDDLALAFRGVAAEVKRARVGVLLQPAPGDGELFGIRVPPIRASYPVGRGLLMAANLLAANLVEPNRAPDLPGRSPHGDTFAPDTFSRDTFATDALADQFDDGPIAIQVAQP